MGDQANEEVASDDRHAQMLRAAMEGMDHGILVYDQDLNVISFNAQLTEILEIEPGILEIGAPFEKLVRYVVGRGGQINKVSVDDQIDMRMKIARSFEPFFADNTLANGRVLAIRGNPITGGGYVTTYADVTEQRTVDDLIRKNEDRLKRLLEGSPVGISILDLETQSVIYRNSMYNNIFSLAEDVQLDAADNSQSFVDQAAAARLNIYLSEGREEYEEILERRRGDGTTVWCHHIWHLITWQGHEAQICWLFDLTGQRDQEAKIRQQNDELDRLNHQKDRFFSILAHDLRSPFTALRGFSDLLVADADTMEREQIKEFAGYIGQGSDVLLELLDNLLYWSRSQMKNIRLAQVPCRLSDLILAVRKTLEPAANKKNICIEADDNGIVVLADRDMITTVLRNLISNAIKFTPENGLIRISGHLHDKEAEISVKDSGVGMDPEQLDNLFRLESNASTPGTSGETGTGLGLVLCDEFVRENAGRIHVTSEVDKGTTFTLSLPLAREEKEETHVSETDP